MNLRTIGRGLVALGLVLCPALALAGEHVPLWMSVARYVDPAAESYVSLNQDGSWTIKGEFAAFGEGLGEDYACVVTGLRREAVSSNPSPDNGAPMSFARMRAVICADPIVQSCRREMNLTCEVVISQR